MNKIKLAILKKATVLLLLVTIGACDYLDIVPDNVATIDYAFRSRETAEQFLFTCYGYRPQIGDIDWDPAMSGGDEIWQYRPIYTYFRTFEGQYIARGAQNTVNPYFNFWDGSNAAVCNLWTAIRDCNIFLEKMNDPNVTEMIDQLETERIRWISEIKFLKAYYHWYLLRAYGPIPIMDVNLPISADVEQVQVWREPIDEVVEYIVGLLNEALTGLPDVQQLIIGTEGGRVDQLATLTLIAEIRLWAASPLVNEKANLYGSMVDKRGKNLFPTAYDPNKWALAMQACETAINECHKQGKSLYRVVDPLLVGQDTIFKIQTVIRQTVTDRWNSELIWGGTSFNCQELSYRSTPHLVLLNAQFFDRITAEWSPTVKMVNLFHTSNGVPVEEDKQWQANHWDANRYAIRPEPSSDSNDEKYYVKAGEQTVNLHFNREPRFYADIGFDRGIYFGAGYNKFENVKYCMCRKGEITGIVGGSGYSITGYSAKKMNSFKSTQTTSSASYEYYPFPIYRLADLYLMYAEAVNEVEGPNGAHSQQMFEYLDAIRNRAGLEPIRDAWSKYASDPDKPTRDKDGLREIIHRERTIELMFEGKRFWDIRRWCEINTLNEQPQGWNLDGKTAEDFYNLVNVNPTTVSFGVRDYFFPIKESSLNVNLNLMQNYGW